MEELLASIRLIISDGDKRGPVERDLSHRGDAVAPARGPTTAMAPSDEVLDLTDELVFPEPLAAPTVTPAAEPGAPEPVAGQPVKTRAVEELAAPPVLAPEAFAREAFRETRPTAQTRQAPSQQSQGPAGRPIWSGRELAKPQAQGEAGTKPSRDTGTSRAPLSASWDRDIHMPIPDSGPVSLFSGRESSLVPGKQERQAAPPDEDGAKATESGASVMGLDGEEEAAVAALAEKLARSAAQAMEASELENAQRVDFENLDESHKADVTEKFVEVIERESAHGAATLPTLLDEVFRKETIRPPEPAEEIPPEDADPETQWRERAMNNPPSVTKPAMRPETSPRPRPAQNELSPQQPSPPIQPLTQAHYVGPAPASLPSSANRTLEDAVREMLRPLLVQWLNEHMPRILENAIREELATRGLDLKSDG